ncbi:hypothetical protein BH20GEM1_BH20GEM1_19570 [soil metagenome]
MLPAMALIVSLAAGCGNPEDDAPVEPPDTTTAPADTVPATADTSAVELTPVELPADFPADFPIAPASTVVSATSVPDAGGAFHEVSMASQGESATSYEWYRRALTDAGWQVSSEGQTDDTRTLHATRGESYVDLTVRPHPSRPTGWVRMDASIWKVGP